MDEINALNSGTIHEALGIRISAIGADYLEGTMPVDGRTKQPAGFLHGGASVVLAESLGSLCSIFTLGDTSKNCFGIEVNASHLKAIRGGTVTGRATAVQIGSRLHHWEIRLTDESGALVSICRLMVYVRS